MEGGSRDKIALFLYHIRLAPEHGDPAYGNPSSSYYNTKKRPDFPTTKNILGIKPVYILIVRFFDSIDRNDGRHTGLEVY